MPFRFIFLKLVLTVFSRQRKKFAPPIHMLRAEISSFPSLRLASSESGLDVYDGIIKEEDDNDPTYFISVEVRDRKIVTLRLGSEYLPPVLVVWLIEKEGLSLKYKGDDVFQGLYITDDHQTIVTWSNLTNQVSVITIERYQEMRAKKNKSIS